MTRRSTRVRAQIPILITSLDPSITLSLLCETLIVNAHGCAARVPQPLAIGLRVRLQIRDSEVTGRVVLCQPIDRDRSDWLAGIELDKSGNFWGLKPVPKDWAAAFDRGAAQSRAGESAIAPMTPFKTPAWPLASPSEGTAPAARTVQEELEKKLAQQQEAIAKLQDRLASLEATSEVVRDRLAKEQQQIMAQVHQQLDAALAEFAGSLQEDGRAADLRSEVRSLLSTLQQESERCQTQVRTLLQQKEEFQVWIAERTGNFQKLLDDALGEATEQINGRLQMALEAVEQPVEKLRDETMQQLQQQAGMQAKLVGEKFDEAGERLASLQRQIESTVAEALRVQAAETSAAFGREIAQIAQQSVQEWRAALARNLASITNSLGQNLPGADK